MILRKIFLDELPKRGKLIDWKKSIGFKTKFIYDGIEGQLEIVGYDGKKLKLKYKDTFNQLQTDDLKNCKIGKLIGCKPVRYEDHKFNTGDIVSTSTSDIELTEKTRIGETKTKAYVYRCLNCENVDVIRESDLKRTGCNVCCIPSKKVLKGYNDLWTTHPEIAKLLKNSDNGYILSKGTHRKEIFRCGICGFEEEKNISNIVKQGFSCSRCSDGISYPEKFVSNILNQLNIHYERDYIFDWSEGIEFRNSKGNRRYDFYIPSSNCIIETHGRQHYDGIFEKLGGRTLNEEQENDEFKKKLAIKNGVKNYIIIDCKESDMLYIKNNIQNTSLMDLLPLGDIDWLQSHEFACNTLIKEACKLWEIGVKNTLEISKIMKKSRTTVTTYLKKGSEIGWCDYNRLSYINHLKKGRSVCQLNEEDGLIVEWSNIKEASRKLGIPNTSIGNVCKGKYGYNRAGGFKWMYKEDYDEYLKQAN